jgi:hypothetical protein
LAAALAQEGVSAATPLTLVSATVNAALAYAAATGVAISAPVAALTEGVLRTMLLNKLRATIVFLVVLGLTGFGWGNYRGLAIDPPEPAPAAQPPTQTEVKESSQPKRANDSNRPDQAKQILEMVLRGFQAYQAMKTPPPKPGRPLLRVPLPVRTMMTVALSGNGKLLAVAPHDKTIVRLWEVTTGKEHTLQGNPFPVTALAFSPDGNTLATGTGSWLPEGAAGEIKLWDVDTGKERATIGRLPQMILALAFSPDGKTLASASTSVKLWDVSSGKEKSEPFKLDPREGACWSIAFSPDGKSVAVGLGVLEDNTPGTAIQIDTEASKVRATLGGHKGVVACVAFAPDGKTLATADSRGTLKLWDVATAKERATFPNRDSTFATFFLQPLAFTSDSQTAVATIMLADPDREGSAVALKEWNIADGKERTIYKAIYEAKDKNSLKPTPMVISGDATIVGLASCWSGEGPLVAPGSQLELWERRSLPAKGSSQNQSQDIKGGDKKTEQPNQAALDTYWQAFLRAFEVSSEIAKAKEPAKKSQKRKDGK